MKKNSHIRALLLAFLMFCASTSLAQLSTSGRPPIPKLTSPVYDETGTLSSEQVDNLRRKLRANEDSTSTQIAIVIVNTLNGYPASDFAIEVGQENKVGQGKKNNGAIILLAKNDHKGFIASGYGLEPTLTDAMSNYIYQEILRPALKEGDFYGGLDKTTDAIIKATAGEFKSASKSKDKGSPGSAMIIVLIFFIILVIVRGVFGSGARRTIIGSGGGGSGCMGGLLQGLFWSSIFRGGSGGGSWGGFSGGGSSGGGWSGGGGSFGGGGAGGDW